MEKQRTSFMAIALLSGSCGLLGACATGPTGGDGSGIPYGGADEVGCVAPPRSVFDRYPAGFRLADLQLGKTDGAGLAFETSARVVRAASEMTIDPQILAYAACRTARHYGYNPSQEEWQRRFAAVLATRPSAEQINGFYRNDPFPPARPAKPTASLAANPATITEGESSVLVWATEHATGVTIAPVGAVGGAGSRTVSPAATTTYQLVATGPGGRREAMATITVRPRDPVLEAARVHFHTTYNEKDADTRVTVSVLCGGTTVAVTEGTWGMFAKQSDSGWKDLTLLERPRKDAIAGGCTAVLAAAPAGGDEWLFSWMLDLSFSDESSRQYVWCCGDVDRSRTTIRHAL